MKKISTIVTSLLICIGLSAQIIPGHNYNKLLKAKNDKVDMRGDEVLNRLILSPNQSVSANLKTSSLTETVIGITTYDLQSNAAVQNRIIMHHDGSISTAWTMSQQYNTTWADRGTGYNFFDGTSWGAQPTDRLEASRGGWPSILKMGSGKEASMTHNTANSYINMAHRATTGSGTWTDQIISTQDSNGVYRYLIWNRSAVGGLNNETIHMVALTEPSGGTWTGVPFNGVSGALLYYRSQDEGVTWDRQDIQLPGTDSSTQIGMSGDVYAIAAQGETVVIAYFDDWGDSFIIKSIDNGDTWTTTTFLDFPVDKYTMDDGVDLDGDGTLDQLYSSDNNGAVVLDANGQAHVFYGIMMYLDDDLTDGSSSWFPGINGLAYWNESYGEDLTPATVHAGDTSLWYSDMMNDHWITAAPDLDGDGIVAGVDSSGGYALYYNSRASMPNAGLSANGEIYLSFSGYTETAHNGSQVFRHVYITKSSDGGTTWRDPVDVTPHTIWDGAQECVFASMNPAVDDKIRIVYQKDFEPGLAVRGDEDMVDNNEIIYLEIDTVGLFDAPLAITQITSSTHFSVYPNPATNFTTLEISSDKAQTIKISVFDLLGKEITKKEKVIFSGTTLETINISEYQNGIYFVNLQIGTQVITKKLVITN
jgi:hypothetical protein